MGSTDKIDAHEPFRYIATNGTYCANPTVGVPRTLHDPATQLTATCVRFPPEENVENADQPFADSTDSTPFPLASIPTNMHWWGPQQLSAADCPTWLKACGVIDQTPLVSS
jgi:hypothetical protein